MEKTQFKIKDIGFGNYAVRFELNENEIYYTITNDVKLIEKFNASKTSSATLTELSEITQNNTFGKLKDLIMFE
jgi:hypothetical protein